MMTESKLPSEGPSHSDDVSEVTGPSYRSRTSRLSLNSTKDYSSSAKTLKQQFVTFTEDEVIVKDFSCALKTDRLIQGRCYLSNKGIYFLGSLTSSHNEMFCYDSILSIMKINFGGIKIIFNDRKIKLFSMLNRSSVFAAIKSLRGELSVDDLEECSSNCSHDGGVPENLGSNDVLCIPSGKRERRKTPKGERSGSASELKMSSCFINESDCSLEGELIVNDVSCLTIDELEDRIFGASPCMDTFRSENNIYDYKSSLFARDVDGTCRASQSFKVSKVFMNRSVEVSTTTVREVISDKHVHYRSESKSSGVSYADAVCVHQHLCVIEKNPSEVHLKISFNVELIKSVNSLLKGKIMKESINTTKSRIESLRQHLLGQVKDKVIESVEAPTDEVTQRDISEMFGRIAVVSLVIVIVGLIIALFIQERRIRMLERRLLELMTEVGLPKI